MAEIRRTGPRLCDVTHVIDVRTPQPWALVVHGGAGAPAWKMTMERLKGIHQGLSDAYGAGEEVLSRGGAALDAVCAAVAVLEDDPLFNSGRGAALTAAGDVEHDASVMSGDGRGGAVALSRHTRHPVLLARAVRDNSAHVLLADPPDELVASWGLEMVSNEWFVTEHQREHLAEVRARVAVRQHGTVGAVALDRAGHVAAATSTGGAENQASGRIGDTPLLGAGTWARDDVVAVSCTGAGEAFMQGAVAHQVSARIEYGLQDVADSARTVINNEIGGREAIGGLIAVTPKRRCVLAWNSPGFLAAWWENGELRTRM